MAGSVLPHSHPWGQLTFNPSSGRGQLCTALRHLHVLSGSSDQGHPSSLWWQQTSVAMNPDMFLMAAQARTPPMVPGDITSHPHQTVPHYNPVSSPAPPHRTRIPLLLPLLYFSTICPLLLMAPRISESPRSPQEWSQECYTPPTHYSTDRGHLQHGLAP